MKDSFKARKTLAVGSNNFEVFSLAALKDKNVARLPFSLKILLENLLRFEDGVEGSVFLGNLLEIGAFQLWRDVREFEKVSVDPHTACVTWEGGIRLDSDILYHDVKANQIQHAGAGEPKPAVG